MQPNSHWFLDKAKPKLCMHNCVNSYTKIGQANSDRCFLATQFAIMCSKQTNNVHNLNSNLGLTSAAEGVSVALIEHIVSVDVS